MARQALAPFLLASAALPPSPVHAGDRPAKFLDGVVVGVAAHEIASDEEGGTDVTLELRFRSVLESGGTVEILPTIGGTLNARGGTNTAYVGATARFGLTERVFIEGFFGLTVHDADTPRTSDGLDLGCTLLFREGAGIGYRHGDHTLSLSVSHASHGDILCDGPNDGMTGAGLRYGYRF